MSTAAEPTVQETAAVEQVPEQVQVQDQDQAQAQDQVQAQDEKSGETKKEASIPPVNLIPAPIPTSSPWKAVKSDIPTTSISVEDFDQLKRKSPTPSIKSNPSTKWVPIKASITVSNKQNKNNNANGSNAKKQGNNNKHKQNSRKHSNKKNNAPAKKDESAPTTESNEEATATDSTTAPEEGSAEHQQQQNNKQHKRFNNKHHHNNNRKPQQQNGSNPRTNNPNFRHNNNQKHRNFRPQQMAQLYSMLYPLNYSMMAVNSVARQIEYYLSEENLAKDDYLKQNISKDGFVPLSLLAKFYRLLNMSLGGDLNIIMAALREIVVNEQATVEIVQGEQIINPADETEQKQEEPKKEEQQISEGEAKKEGETEEEKETEVTEPSPLTKYFIRAKQWQQWVPEQPKLEIEIHKTLSGTDLDECMLKVVNVPHHHHHHHSHRNNHNNTEGEQTDAAPAPATENTATETQTIPVENAEKEVAAPVEVNQSS